MSTKRSRIKPWSRFSRTWTRPPAKRVVIIDFEGWESFQQWGAALRSAGLDVVRVAGRERGARSVFRDLADYFLYGNWDARVDPASDIVATLTLQQLLTPPTVDVVAPEDVMCALVDEGGVPDVIDPPRVPVRADLPLLYDKRQMTRFAVGHGLGAPRTWEALPEQLPVVVKGRIGAGGQNVRVVTTDAELRSAVAQLERVAGPVFFQEFWPGPVVNAAGVSRDGTILVHAVYRVKPPADDPLGPPELMEVVNLPEIERQLHELVAQLKYTGIFCMDYVLDHDGKPGLIDCNPRLFGGWLPLQMAGVNLLGAYLSLLDLADPPEPTRLPPGTMLTDRILPHGGLENWSQWKVDARFSVSRLLAVRAVTGWRFVAVSSVRAGFSLATQGSRLLVKTNTRRSTNRVVGVDNP